MRLLVENRMNRRAGRIRLGSKTGDSPPSREGNQYQIKGRRVMEKYAKAGDGITRRSLVTGAA